MTSSSTGNAVFGLYVPVNQKDGDGDEMVMLDGALIKLIVQSLSGLVSVYTASLTISLKLARSPSQIRRRVMSSGFGGAVGDDEKIPVNRFSLATRILVGGDTFAIYGGSNSICVAVGSVIVVVNPFAAV
jgi:hypothetical protein